LGIDSEDFYVDYGHALADLASLLEQSTYFEEALNCFNQVILKNPSNFSGWYHKACCFLRLSETSLDISLLQQADESFAKAAKIDSKNGLLWMKWAQMEMIFGKATRNLKKVEDSLDKFKKADEIDPNHPHVLSSWAETELFLGAQHEKLEWIQSAKAKITKSLEINPESPDGWYLYGSCLNELGRYFGEEEYYRQAIEKFQYGLSLTRQNPLLWYGLALAHFAIGELTEEQHFFEKAIHYCSRVIECGGGIFAQFWNDWGVALMKLAEVTGERQLVEQAIEKFERALKQPLVDLDMSDLDLEWVYNYGCAFDLLGDLTEEAQYFEKSIQILQQILELDPDYVQARYNLAMAYSHLGEAMCDIEPYYKAIEHFQMMLEQDPEDEIIHVDFGVSLINLAILVHDIHHVEQSHVFYRRAENHLMQAIALGHTHAYYPIAGLYSLTDHLQHAMHYLEKAHSSRSLPPLEDLLHDEWLEAIRQTPAFKQFINQLSSQQFNDDK
jgi:tetratricopeptide (TPR) repeat protein